MSVIQGSVLSCILYLVYILDLPLMFQNNVEDDHTINYSRAMEDNYTQNNQRNNKDNLHPVQSKIPGNDNICGRHHMYSNLQ